MFRLISIPMAVSPAKGECDIAKRSDGSLVNRETDGDVFVAHITEYSLWVGFQNELVNRIIDRGRRIPVSR